MATAKESTLYVRNSRPNMIIFRTADGTRHKLEHRGHRQDSTALPIEALSDPIVSRWLKIGQLEKISREDFMELGKRVVDVTPNEFLQRKIRNARAPGLAMHPADSDTTKTLTQIVDTEVGRAANPSPQWAGDLMTTSEELETMDFSQAASYPSKHRDEELRREMGY